MWDIGLLTADPAIAGMVKAAKAASDYQEKMRKKIIAYVDDELFEAFEQCGYSKDWLMENPQRVEIETLSEPFGYVERYSVDYEPLFVVRRETVFIKYGSRPGFRTELHIYFYDRKQKGEKL